MRVKEGYTVIRVTIEQWCEIMSRKTPDTMISDVVEDLFNKAKAYEELQ